MEETPGKPKPTPGKSAKTRNVDDLEQNITTEKLVHTNVTMADEVDKSIKPEAKSPEKPKPNLENTLKPDEKSESSKLSVDIKADIAEEPSSNQDKQRHKKKKVKKVKKSESKRQVNDIELNENEDEDTEKEGDKKQEDHKI